MGEDWALPEFGRNRLRWKPLFARVWVKGSPLHLPVSRLSPDPPQEKDTAEVLGFGAREDSRGKQSASPLAPASVLNPGREAAALRQGPLLSQQLLNEGRGRHVHRAHLPEAGQPHRTEARSALNLGERAR